MLPHNMTWMKYPSLSKDPSTNFEDIIFSQQVISRFMHAYIACFVPAGLLAGIVILGICIKNYRSRTLETLDVLFFPQTISSIFLILLSLTIAVRPAYLKLSYIKCGTLSFFFSLGYFCSQYLLVLMVLNLFLSRHPPQNAFISKVYRNPKVCVGFVLMCSSCLALIPSALLGIENYQAETDCQLDPLFVWPEYEIIKFTFGFCAPSLFELLCLVLAFVKKTRPDSHRSGKNTYPLSAILVMVTTRLVCHLFYNIMILSRTSLKIKGDIGTPQNELVMNIAEVVLFGESCVSLVILLCLHRPYRTTLLNTLKNLTTTCRRRRESNRSLEIQETQPGPSEIRSH
ncbi:uncharacterized protein LOC103057955 [Python bivittatus]|uniref:Uncharacterized protein LOC103057955 n=1 Tax=Python bivittatus TaxID=176946 RepID=A0A9F5J842_PYTBI|nr:uncharacterized protein LOC103057955 [Python bivittatus]XP_025031961.1 uncharacterized protein LOC103057955 [Python bivittatus]